MDLFRISCGTFKYQNTGVNADDVRSKGEYRFCFLKLFYASLL